MFAIILIYLNAPKTLPFSRKLAHLAKTTTTTALNNNNNCAQQQQQQHLKEQQ